jgi:hypothetical protein
MEIARTNKFFGGVFDEKAMVETVDTKLCRHKGGIGKVG